MIMTHRNQPAYTARRQLRATIACLAVALVVAIVSPARATWSIILVDTESKEIGVASATCLTGFDLERNLPVVLVETGAACAQSAIDGGAVNRMLIHEELLKGTDPEEILELLADSDNNHQSRQYGIADHIGRAVTFTGTQAGRWRGGVTGQYGNVVYAIQGNVLTGEPVILEAEAAILNTPGDMVAKLMAGMEAARLMGGDGRCSCSPNDPDGCGSPPPSFTKTAHVGFFIIARAGDADGPCGSGTGCAAGDYFIDINIAFQSSVDPDPVIQIQNQLNTIRGNLLGRPDAVASSVSFDPPIMPADPLASSTMSITLRDWQGNLVDDPAAEVTVTHAERSSGVSTIGPVVYLGDGAYEVELTGAARAGLDSFDVVVDDGGRDVVLIPRPEIISLSDADFDQDGYVDRGDYALLSGCMTGPGEMPEPACLVADVDFDLDIDMHDAAELLEFFTDRPCTKLELVASPEWTWVGCGEPISLTVEIDADPLPSFQWYLEGEPIPGARRATYYKESAENSDAGLYTCVMTSDCGTVETVPARLRIYPACE
jgi:hypothetical protein